MTPYDNGFISFFLGRALEDNPYLQQSRSKRKGLSPVQMRFVEDNTGDIVDWEKGWKKASQYSKNDRYPTSKEQIHLN